MQKRRRGTGRYGVRLLRADQDKFRRMRAILGYEEQQQPESPSHGARAAGISKAGTAASGTAGGAEQVTISMLQTMHYLDFPLSYRRQLAAYRVGTLSMELEGMLDKTRRSMLEAKAAELRSNALPAGLPGMQSLLGYKKE